MEKQQDPLKICVYLVEILVLCIWSFECDFPWPIDLHFEHVSSKFNLTPQRSRIWRSSCTSNSGTWQHVILLIRQRLCEWKAYKILYISETRDFQDVAILQTCTNFVYLTFKKKTYNWNCFYTTLFSLKWYTYLQNLKSISWIMFL